MNPIPYNESNKVIQLPHSTALSAVMAGEWMILENSYLQVMQIASRVNLDVIAAHAIAEQKAEERMQVGGTKIPGSRRSVMVNGGVAVVPVFDVLFRRADMLAEISGAMSMESILTDFTAAIYHPDVNSVMLDIDSPGGTVNFTHELVNAIMQMSQETGKFVEAFCSGMMCSGSFWIGSAANRRSVSPTAIVGSVGVMTSYVDTSKMDEALGIQEIHIVSSVSPDKHLDPTTETGLAGIQKMIDSMGNIFANDMAANLGVEVDKVLSWKGGVKIGKSAVNAGMANRVATRQEVLNSLAKKKPKPYTRVYGAAPSSLALIGGDQKMESQNLSDTINSETGGNPIMSAEQNAPQGEAVSFSPQQTGFLQSIFGSVFGSHGSANASALAPAVVAPVAAQVAEGPTAREKALMETVAQVVCERHAPKLTAEGSKEAFAALFSRAQEFGCEAEVEALMASLPSPNFSRDVIPPAQAQVVAQDGAAGEDAFTAACRAEGESLANSIGGKQ